LRTGGEAVSHGQASIPSASDAEALQALGVTGPESPCRVLTRFTP